MNTNKNSIVLLFLNSLLILWNNEFIIAWAFCCDFTLFCICILSLWYFEYFYLKLRSKYHNAKVNIWGNRIYKFSIHILSRDIVNSLKIWTWCSRHISLTRVRISSWVEKNWIRYTIVKQNGGTFVPQCAANGWVAKMVYSFFFVFPVL